MYFYLATGLFSPSIKMHRDFSFLSTGDAGKNFKVKSIFFFHAQEDIKMELKIKTKQKRTIRTRKR